MRPPPGPERRGQRRGQARDLADAYLCHRLQTSTCETGTAGGLAPAAAGLCRSRRLGAGAVDRRRTQRRLGRRHPHAPRIGQGTSQELFDAYRETVQNAIARGQIEWMCPRPESRNGKRRAGSKPKQKPRRAVALLPARRPWPLRRHDPGSTRQAAPSVRRCGVHHLGSQTDSWAKYSLGFGKKRNRKGNKN